MQDLLTFKKTNKKNTHNKPLFAWFTQIWPQIHKLIAAEAQSAMGDKKSPWVQGD